MVLAGGEGRASVLWFRIVGFILVYAGRRKVRASLEARRREIEDAVAEAQRKKAAAEAKREEFEARLAQLDDEVERIRTEAKQTAEEERDRIVAEAKAKAESVRRDTKFQIEQRFKQMKEDLTGEAITAAVAAAEAMLKDKTTASDQQRLADAYLTELEVAAREVTP